MKILRMPQLAAVILTAAFISTSRAASPPQMGDIASDFTLSTLDGHAVRLNDLNTKSEVVLIVLRGWPGYQCPLCTAQAHNFIKNADKFKAVGVQVVMVYPGPADNLSSHATEFMQDKDWPKDFVLLLDPDYVFTQAYGLRWDAPDETAYPSTFVISRTGKITFAHVSHGHGARVKAEKILEILSDESQGDEIK